MRPNIYQLPSEFLERLKVIYPSYYYQIYNTFLIKKQQTFRINYLKVNLKSLKEFLHRERIKYKELVWPEGCFILKTTLKVLQASYIYNQGFIYVQNVSSTIPALILSPKKDDKILDLCAAPGAKTTQIASLAGPDSEIIAIEKIRIRYYKLLANLRIQGADFVRALLYDGIAEIVSDIFHLPYQRTGLPGPHSCRRVHIAAFLVSVRRSVL